ncbi:MAG: chemotaxis protein CheA, partial [Verrucomicrobia bacterium]
TTPATRAAETTTSPPPPAQTRVPATPARPGEPGRSRPRLDPIVRVELGRLDELLRLVGELVITRGRLGDRLQQLHGRVDKALFRELEEAGQLLERQLRDLREGIMRVRMVPLAQAFERMQFAVRDLARETARHVRVVLRGEDTEVDKLVVERMLDPLLHLVRNAVSHGIEPPAERATAGKPETATIELRAAAAGDTVVIEVADDGRGIGLEKVAARARRVGLLGPDEPLDPDRLIDILCAPGFSTREEADHAAGRGVGMSVVRNAVQELGGRLDVTSQPGRGTTWRIQLPLTVLIVDAVLVEVADQTLAMPQPALSEIRRIEAGSIRQIQGGEIIPHRDRLLPLLRLNRVFRWPESKRSTLDVLVVGHEPDLLGLVVDRVLGQREIVVRALDDPLVRTPGIAGATEASDGRAVLILDAAGLVALAAGRRKLRSRSAATVSTPSRTP